MFGEGMLGGERSGEREMTDRGRKRMKEIEEKLGFREINLGPTS